MVCGDWSMRCLPRLLYHERNASSGSVDRREAPGLTLTLELSSAISPSPSTIRTPAQSLEIPPPFSHHRRLPLQFPRRQAHPSETDSTFSRYSRSSRSSRRVLTSIRTVPQPSPRTSPPVEAGTPNSSLGHLEITSPAIVSHVFDSRDSVVLAPLPDPRVSPPVLSIFHQPYDFAQQTA